jgi:hypothetical protein
MEGKVGERRERDKCTKGIKERKKEGEGLRCEKKFILH